jgi:uncharacterized protein YdaL
VPHAPEAPEAADWIYGRNGPNAEQTFAYARKTLGQVMIHVVTTGMRGSVAGNGMNLHVEPTDMSTAVPRRYMPQP